MYKQEDLEKAIIFAAEKHKGQKRKDGTAYIYHPIVTAAILKDAEYDYKYQIAAVLHDVLEDTDTKEQELIDVFGDEIAQAVKCLTRPDGMDEEEYVERVLSNRIAAIVKSADKIHNASEIVQLNPVGKRSSTSLREGENKRKAENYIKKARKYYAKRFMPEVDAQIERADSAVSTVTMPGTAGLTVTVENMRLYSDLQKTECDHTDNISPSFEKPDFSRAVLFFEEANTYYCVYEEAFDVWGSMDVWFLCEEGWVPISYDPPNTPEDDITFMKKEWMEDIIAEKRDEGYFYDFVEFPLLPED